MNYPTPQVEIKLIQILCKIAEDNNFKIIEANTDFDHIHLLTEFTPQHYIPYILKALKGVSARLLLLEFGDELRKKSWDGHLWNPSYFVATVSENTEQQIKDYIKSQKQKLGEDCGKGIQVQNISKHTARRINPKNLWLS